MGTVSTTGIELLVLDLKMRSWVTVGNGKLLITEVNQARNHSVSDYTELISKKLFFTITTMRLATVRTTRVVIPHP